MSKEVSDVDIDRILKGRSKEDESKKIPLGQLLVQVIDGAKARRTRESSLNAPEDVDNSAERRPRVPSLSMA
jgi:hypothetical protein